MDSPIKNFYRNKTVLITGGFGFIGKLTLAKLLRLNIVKEILLLSRPKKGKSSEERLAALFDNILFQDMDHFDKEFRSRVRLLNGDMELDNLGLSQHDANIVKSSVQVIIHGAAAISFDGDFKIAVANNVRGTKLLLDLAVDSKVIESFVFISTAYAQCPRLDLKEIFYEPSMDYRRALNILEHKTDEDSLKIFAKKLIYPWPNSYVFTKAIAEDMVRQYQHKVPVAIVRPSIVISTLSDPWAGFSDSLVGILGVTIGVMIGYFRVLNNDIETFIDIVPADVTVNSILAVGAYTKHDRREDRNIIFNVINNSGKMRASSNSKLVIRRAKEFPTKKAFRVPKNVYRVQSKLLFRILFFYHNVLPAILLDTMFNWFTTTQSTLLKMTRNIVYFVQVAICFDRPFKFENPNMRKLYHSMTLSDHHFFPCTVGLMEVEKYKINSIDGIRKFYFRETEDDLKSAKKRMRVLQIIDFILNLAIGVALYFVYCAIF